MMPASGLRSRPTFSPSWLPDQPLLGGVGDPPDDVRLYRMSWHPDHRDAGGVTGTSAFRKEDLLGRDDFVSVDRSDLFDREAALARALAQQAKAWARADAKGKARTYTASFYIVLPCDGVRAADDGEGVRPFTVSDAWLPENPAHCAIRNESGKQKPSYINRLRKMLLDLVESEHALSAEEVSTPHDAFQPPT